MNYYRYNARDWLLSINGDELPHLDQYHNRLSLNLSYDQGSTQGIDYGNDWVDYPAGYYNGNIASYRLYLHPSTNSSDWTIQKFAYDPFDRLIAEEYSGTADPNDITYSYDKNGNITSIDDSDPTGLTRDYHYYSGTNRLEQITNLAEGSGNFTYTPTGAMATAASDDMNMSYNLHDQLSRRWEPSGYPYARYNELQYWYNHEGKRIAKRYEYWERELINDSLHPEDPPMEPLGLLGMTAYSSLSGPIVTYRYYQEQIETGYYYLGSDMLSSYTGPLESNLVGNYVYVNGQRVAKFEGSDQSNVMYYLGDHLGSVVGTVRGSDYGMFTRAIYRPFGEEIHEDINTANPWSFTGQEKDDELDVA